MNGLQAHFENDLIFGWVRWYGGSLEARSFLWDSVPRYLCRL